MVNSIRKQNYDMLKVIATICIMLIHIGDDYGMHIIKGEPDYYFTLGNACVTLTTFAVPCFLMISGAFLLSNIQNRNFKYFYKKTFFSIGIPTLIASALYFFYNIIKLYYHKSLGIDVLTNPFTYLREWVRGEPFYHMWYMYMMVDIYLLIPFLVRIRENLCTEQRKVITIFCLIASVLIWRNTQFEIHWLLEGTVYICYVLAGDFLKSYYDEHGGKTTRNLILGVVLLLVYCVFREFTMRRNAEPILFGSFNIVVMLASLLIFSGFLTLRIKGDWSKVAQKSFYMYLFHAGIIDVMYIFLPERGNPIVVIPLMLLITFAGSYIVATFLLWLQKKAGRRMRIQ